MKRFFGILLILALVLSGCGGEETPPVATVAPVADDGVVRVTNVEELLAAIAPGNTIELAPGEYRLDLYDGYGKTESPFYTWDDLGLGWYGLTIQYVNGLTIRGAGKDTTFLTTGERMANVLSVVSSNDITIADMTLGHTEAAEACEGGVIRMDNANNSTLRGLGLYGCGTLGVQAWECANLAVEDCEIYECSIGGVQISQCQEVKLTNTSFHHLGKEEPVMHVFAITGCQGVEVSGCTVADNYVENLIYAEWGVTFRNNLFQDNRVVSAAFSLTGEGTVFQDNTFENNELRNWYTPYSSPARDEAGNEVQFEPLVTETFEVVPGVANPVSTGEQKEVRVKNVDEFLAAIDSNTCIVLEASLLDLSQAKTYKEAADLEQMETHSPADNPNYYWVNNFDGPSLVISNVENLTIQGPDRETCTLSAVPRYADVLTFENCSAITLQGFTAGHTEEEGYCTGGVFALNNCSNVLIDSCGMFGCGTEGINAESSLNIQVVNSEIYECSYTGIYLYNSENVAISGTVIRDIRNDWQGEAPYFTFSDSRNITLDGQSLDGNYTGR